MKFKNDPEKLRRWFEKNGGNLNQAITPEEQKRLDFLAAEAMSAHTPVTGDHKCMGWFVYEDIRSNEPVSGETAASDGICQIASDGCAAIGIRRDILNNCSMGYLLALAFHEIAHLRFEEHNDNFCFFELDLHFQYYNRERKTNI